MGKIISKGSAFILIAVALCISGCNGIIHMDNQLPSGMPIWARSVANCGFPSIFKDVSINNDAIYTAGFFYGGEINLGNGVAGYGDYLGKNFRRFREPCGSGN